MTAPTVPEMKEAPAPTEKGDGVAIDRGRAHLTGQKPDGSFKWCIYPCQKRGAEGEMCRVSVSPGFNGRVWSVTGPADAPTISPSIDCHGGCGWHGFINDGVLS